MDYQDYKKTALEFNCSEVLTEEQYLALGSGKLRFGPGMFIPNMGQAAGVLRDSAVEYGPRIIDAGRKGGFQGVKSEGVRIVGEIASKNLSGVFTKSESQSQASTPKMRLGNYQSTVSGGSGNSGSSLPSGPSNGGGPGGVSLLGSFDISPAVMEFKPGVVNRTYLNYYQSPTSNETYLSLTGARFAMTTESNISGFFDSIISYIFQTQAQSRVNFAINMSDLSSAKLTAYFNAISYALQVYYFFTSIIAHASLPENRNEGMLALRKMITAEMIDYLNQLGALLESLPIPPNLNTMLFWMNQTFSENTDLPGGGLLKMMPISFSTAGSTSSVISDFSGLEFTAFPSDSISNRIVDLNTAEVKGVANILARVIPNWLNTKMVNASPIPLESSSFMTFFSNLPYTAAAHGVANISGPSFTSSASITAATGLFYNSYDVALDGAFIGLYNIRFDDLWVSNFISPVSSLYVGTGASYAGNRYTYTYSSTLSRPVLRWSTINIEAAYGRPDTYQILNNSVNIARKPGSIVLKGVSVLAIRESGKDILNWLFSTSQLPDKKENNRGYSQRKSRNSKSNGSGKV